MQSITGEHSDNSPRRVYHGVLGFPPNARSAVSAAARPTCTPTRRPQCRSKRSDAPLPPSSLPLPVPRSTPHRRTPRARFARPSDEFPRRCWQIFRRRGDDSFAIYNTKTALGAPLRRGEKGGSESADPREFENSAGRDRERPRNAFRAALFFPFDIKFRKRASRIPLAVTGRIIPYCLAPRTAPMDPMRTVRYVSFTACKLIT